MEKPPNVPVEVSKAYHEAGHAVATVLCGGMVVEVTLGETPHTLSEVWVPGAELVILAGGVAAEALLTGGWSFGGGQDCEMLAEMGVAGDRLEKLVGDVAKLLRENWRMVEAVAARLAVAGRMDGGEVALVLLAEAVDRLLGGGGEGEDG